MPAAGIVLCGGMSSRMGRPKALLPWQGRTVLEVVIDVLRSVADEVVAVTSGEFELPAVDAHVIQDREPRLGPLGGIRDGLAVVGSDLAFVASTDAPFLSASFVKAMLGFGGAAACEYDGHVQTLCAVYDRRYCEVADALIREKRMRPLFLLEESGYRRVLPDEVPASDSIRGFNTPKEYLAALRATDGPAILEFLGHAGQQARLSRIEVQAGTLGEILRSAEPELFASADGEIPKQYLVSLNARAFVRNASMPVGPGDHIIVMDSAVGG